MAIKDGDVVSVVWISATLGCLNISKYAYEWTYLSPGVGDLVPMNSTIAYNWHVRLNLGSYAMPLIVWDSRGCLSWWRLTFLRFVLTLFPRIMQRRPRLYVLTDLRNRDQSGSSSSIYLYIYIYSLGQSAIFPSGLGSVTNLSIFACPDRLPRDRNDFWGPYQCGKTLATLCTLIVPPHGFSIVSE